MLPLIPAFLSPANSVLNSRICNTSATRTWYIAAFGRFFDTSSTVLTEYFGAANPDTLSTTQAATLTACGAVSPNTCNLSYGTNLLPGGPAQTDITFSFGVGSVMTCGGTACVPSGNGLIYPGMKNEISKPRAIPPGKCFGQTAVGQNNANGLGTAAAYFIFRAYLYYGPMRASMIRRLALAALLFTTPAFAQVAPYGTTTIGQATPGLIPTPSNAGQILNALPWSQNTGQIQTTDIQTSFNNLLSVISGLGTWTASGVYSPPTPPIAIFPVLVNGPHVGTSADPSTSVCPDQHFYSGLLVNTCFAYDAIAQSPIQPEQTGMFRMYSNVGLGGPGLIYKMPWGSEGNFDANSAPGWGGTVVGNFMPGYSQGNSEIGLEIDHNNDTGANCVDGDNGFNITTTTTAPTSASKTLPVTSITTTTVPIEAAQVGTLVVAIGIPPQTVITAVNGTTLTLSNAATVAAGAPVTLETVTCSTIYITGAGNNQITSAISISGYSRYRYGMQFNSGGPVVADLRSYSTAIRGYVDTGSHVDGIDFSGSTLIGNFLRGPNNNFGVDHLGNLAAASLSSGTTLSVTGVSTLGPVNATTINATSALYLNGTKFAAGLSGLNVLYDAVGNNTVDLGSGILDVNANSIVLRNIAQTVSYATFSASSVTVSEPLTLAANAQSGTAAGSLCITSAGVVYTKTTTGSCL